jgi:hypothetical protein
VQPRPSFLQGEVPLGTATVERLVFLDSHRDDVPERVGSSGPLSVTGVDPLAALPTLEGHFLALALSEDELAGNWPASF